MQEVLARHGGLPQPQYLAILEGELAAGRRPELLPPALLDRTEKSAPVAPSPAQHRDLLHILAHWPYRIWFELSQ